ncbi:MAG: c-type cytochrome [Hydrogenophaga sp.]
MNTRHQTLQQAAFGLFLITAQMAAMGQTAPPPAPAPAATAAVNLIGRPVPDIASLPADAHRALVEYGQQLTERTYAHIGPEVKNARMRYAGNNLACVSCHQAGATKPFAMPWTGVTATFPQYRAREDDISTVEERVNGCMQRSMNGKPLPLDSREMKAFTTYIAFLSRGIPVGATLHGAATVQSKMPNRRADPTAGAAVYAARCAVCHGENGQGQRVGQKGDAQGYTFPPLWGPDSFNTGAGMNRLVMATRFVKHNMPLGASHDATQLTDDEAYDVSAFMVSQPRPVKARLEADFPARWNKPVDAAFPPYLLGTADQHKYGPFPPLAEQQKQRAEQLKAQAATERAARVPASR